MPAPLGFMGAILDVDLSAGTHSVRELSQDMADAWLGLHALRSPQGGLGAVHSR